MFCKGFCVLSMHKSTRDFDIRQRKRRSQCKPPQGLYWRLFCHSTSYSFALRNRSAWNRDDVCAGDCSKMHEPSAKIILAPEVYFLYHPPFPPAFTLMGVFDKNVKETSLNWKEVSRLDRLWSNNKTSSLMYDFFFTEKVAPDKNLLYTYFELPHMSKQ